MSKLTRLAAASLLLCLAAGPVFAASAKTSPAGSWQSSDGQAWVKVTLCGDGTQLCAKLTAVSGEARTPENLQLLDSYVVQGAQQADTNVWQGKVHFNGQTADGHIALVDPNTITVSGCQMGMCKTFQFQRVSAVAAAKAVLASDQLPQMPPRTVGLTLPE